MSLLQRTLSWEQLVAWGALRLYPERHVRKWFGDRGEVSVDEALSVGTKASRVFWAVLRPEVLPEDVLHHIAVDLASRFLEQLAEQGTPIDDRLRGGLEAKRTWIRGEISLGALAHEQRLLADHEARQSIQRAEDDVLLAALATRCALRADPRSAVRGVFYTIIERFDDKPSHADRVRTIRARLNAPTAGGTPCSP